MGVVVGRFVWLVGLLLAPVGECRERGIPYEVPGARPSELVAVRGALYFAPGECFVEAHRSAGRGWVQTHAIARHRDRSIRWLAVEGVVPGRGRLVPCPDRPNPETSLAIHVGAERLVDGPRGRLEHRGGTLSWMTEDGDTRLQLELPELTVHDAEGGACRLEPEPWTFALQHREPCGAVFEGRSSARSAEGGSVLVTLVVQLGAEGAWLDVEGTITVLAHGGFRLAGVRWPLRLPPGVELIACDDGTFPDEAETCRQVGANVLVRDPELQEDGRLTERIHVRDARTGEMELAFPRIARYWPVAMERIAGDSTCLMIDLAPEGRTLERGRSLGLRWRAASGASDTPVRCSRPLRRIGKRIALPGIDYEVAPVNRSAAPRLQRVLDAHLRDLVTWMHTWKGGWEHYGDLPLREEGEGRTWSHLEFDPVRGLVLEWLRGGDARLLEIAEDLAFHHRVHSIPVVHADAERIGLPLRHASRARTPRRVVDVGHAWLEGHLILGRVLARSSIAATGLAMQRALLELHVDGKRDGDLERTFAWPLLGLAAVSEEGQSEAAMLGTGRWADLLLRHFDPAHGVFDFAGRRTQSGGTILQTWLAGGLLLLAMQRIEPAIPRARDWGAARRALLDIVWEHAHDRDARAFAMRVLFREDAEPVRIGCCQGPREALLLAGLGLAAERGSDEAQRVAERIRRAGETLFELTTERRFNDLALLLWATPHLLGRRFGDG